MAGGQFIRLGVAGLLVGLLAPAVVLGVPLRDVLYTNPLLSESARFAEDSGVLSDLENNAYGSMTVLFPSNEAWGRVSQSWKEHLRRPENREDLETLLLFSTTDAIIKKADVYDGMPPLVTLLGVEAEVHKPANEICVLSMETGDSYACAQVVQWDIDIDYGVIHIIDEVLFPEELQDLLSGSGGGWRRLVAEPRAEGADDDEPRVEDAAVDSEDRRLQALSDEEQIESEEETTERRMQGMSDESTPEVEDGEPTRQLEEVEEMEDAAEIDEAVVSTEFDSPDAPRRLQTADELDASQEEVGEEEEE